MKQVQATVLIGLAAALLSGAGGRRKLWELDLSKFTDHQTDMAAQIWGIRFSPDETKVAIGFGPLWNFDPRPRHVVVVAVINLKPRFANLNLTLVHAGRLRAISFGRRRARFWWREADASHASGLEEVPRVLFPTNRSSGAFLAEIAWSLFQGQGRNTDSCERLLSDR